MAWRADGHFANGLTLLELLVAMLLTSFLALVAYTSLSLSLRASAKGQAEAEVSQELRVGQAFLERSLISAAPRLHGYKAFRPYFLGQSQELRFLTTTPLEAHSPAGIYHFRAFVGQDQRGRPCLAVEQTAGMAWLRNPEEVEIRQILIRNLADLKFTYGRAGKTHEAWDGSRQNRLPDWVEVTVAMSGREPQVWLIPLRVAETQESR
ncbi:MAG: prepilin-type N-terminal cleavage/methylation domain-containing protein [Deltaproteobacteria bacterium]|nr:prepilin-type N-terminal cleavage/methylation domain-containing protein [Deltaproteobacteria bacterium]